MTTTTMPRESYFDAAEYDARMDAVRRLMEARGIDVLVTSSPGNICYLTGHFTWNLWDPMFLVIAAHSDPRIYLWQFEAGRYMASGSGPQAEYWALHDDPVEFVVQAMASASLTGKRVALDTGATYTPFDMMARLKARLDAQPAQGVVEEARLVKSPAELALLENAAAMTDTGVRAGLEAVEVGAADYRISAQAAHALLSAGSDFLVVDPVVCVGWRSGTPHTHRGGTVVQQGDTVFFEMGASKGRYTSPLMRCAVAGEAVRPEVAELAEFSSACLDALITAARPGARACDVAAAGKAALEPILERIAFHYTFGYPVGIGFPPSWLENPGFLISAQNQGELKQGMVFHLPLMLRVLGRYGAGFSETIAITHNGARPLSRVPRRVNAS